MKVSAARSGGGGAGLRVWPHSEWGRREGRRRSGGSGDEQAQAAEARVVHERSCGFLPKEMGARENSNREMHTFYQRPSICLKQAELNKGGGNYCCLYPWGG